jgi:hypothetical protein
VPPVWRTQPFYGYPYLGAENTVTIDKWQQPLSRAVPVPRPAPRGLWVFGYPYEGVDNTRTEWDWCIAWEGPPRYWWQGRPYQPFVPAEATVQNTTNTVWPLTQGQKAKPVPRAAPQGHHLFVPKEATVENTTNTVWPLTQGQKARPVARPAPQGLWASGYPYAAIENTTTTVWPLVFGEKARPVPRVAPQGLWVFGYPYLSVPNTVTIDKWQQPLSIAVPIPRPAQTAGRPFVPKEETVANTTVRVWPLTQGLKARPVLRPAPQGGWFFGYPYEGVDFCTFQNDAFQNDAFQLCAPSQRWHRPFSIAVSIPRSAPQGGVVYPVGEVPVIDNTVTPDKWLSRWEGPPRIWPAKTQVIYPVSPITFVDNTVTPDKWLIRWQGPPRYQPPLILAQPFIPAEATVENTVTPDKWLQAWRGPPKYLPCIVHHEWTWEGLGAIFEQAIAMQIELTVDLHVCGWGTAPETAEGFVEQAEQSDPWVEQTEQDDEYDEQDECGR